MFFNFRRSGAPDPRAFVDDVRQFDDGGPRVHYVGMARYEEALPIPTVFAPEARTHILVDTAASHGKKTLRIAETEKYAHVTYFFNGGEEREYPGETRVLIPSAKVATYDQKPEMSAFEVTEALIREIGSDRHDYIICNYANADMVGHKCAMAPNTLRDGGQCAGPCWRRSISIATPSSPRRPRQRGSQGRPGHRWSAHRAHHQPGSMHPGGSFVSGALIEGGSLRDIAPTILNYMGVPRPSEMTGRDQRAEVR